MEYPPEFEKWWAAFDPDELEGGETKLFVYRGWEAGRYYEQHKNIRVDGPTVRG